MDRCEIIVKLVCSLNAGHSGHPDRVELAIKQYNRLVEAGVVKGDKIRV